MHDIKTAVIVDVDGTLCDVSSALHHLAEPNRNFNAFHEATAECPPTPQVIDWCRQRHAEGHVIVVVTARKYQHEALTTAWLDRHLPVPYVGPLMRGDHDNRDDNRTKRDIFNIITSEMWLHVVAAIDDRPRVIALWRSLGIPTTAVHRPDWAAAGEHYDPADVPSAPLLLQCNDLEVHATSYNEGYAAATRHAQGVVHDDPLDANVLAVWFLPNGIGLMGDSNPLIAVEGNPGTFIAYQRDGGWGSFDQRHLPVDAVLVAGSPRPRSKVSS